MQWSLQMCWSAHIKMWRWRPRLLHFKCVFQSITKVLTLSIHIQLYLFWGNAFWTSIYLNVWKVTLFQIQCNYCNEAAKIKETGKLFLFPERCIRPGRRPVLLYLIRPLRLCRFPNDSRLWKSSSFKLRIAVPSWAELLSPLSMYRRPDEMVNNHGGWPQTSEGSAVLWA